MADRKNILKVVELVRDPANFFSMKQFRVDPAYLTCLDDKLFLKVFGAPKPTVTISEEGDTDGVPEIPACIAGWSNHAAGVNLKDERAAAGFLGLAFPQESEKLFRPRLERLKDDKYELALITRAEAVATLERLAETGVVDWVGPKPE